MKLSLDDLTALAKTAIDAAKQAGYLIADHAGRDDLVVEKKESGESLAAQVVTEVDRKSQAMILKAIEQACQTYDLGLLAEESEDDLSRFEKDYFWCIDPIDGTLPFIESRSGYAVSIALVSKEGVPCIGVVYDPLEKILYHAIKGVGAFRDEEPWNVRQTSSDSYETIDRGGAVMNACWVLENAPACFYKKPKPQDGGGCLWDYAATACLFESLGAWVSDMCGNPLELNRKESLYMNHKGVLFASNKAIAKELVLGMKDIDNT